jgi:peptide-methionine (S)-S-oxide reductase
MNRKAGFGGGCHWCTEAVFSSLKGVIEVGQGWIASDGDNAGFSEGVVVEYNPDIIPFEVLIAIHLYTHSSTASHSMRGKYRSAIYTFHEADTAQAKAAITALQNEFDRPIITQVLPFADFKLNKEEQLNYYYTNPSRPFCENYINPKLQLLREKFSVRMLVF